MQALQDGETRGQSGWSPGLRGDKEGRLGRGRRAARRLVRGTDRIGSCSPMGDGPSFRKDRSEGCTENIPVGGGLGSGHESGGYWEIQVRDVLA